MAENQQTPPQSVPAPLPEPLAPNVLTERVDRLVALIRTHGCNDLALALAMGITDPRDGGRAVNLLNAAPQLAVTTADGRQAFDSRLDIDGDGTLEKHELTSTLLTVARIAAEHNISVRDVQINDQFIAMNVENCQKVQEGGEGVCRPSR